MKLIINNNNYELDEKVTNLLDAFLFIKENINKSFSFDYGCKSGVCGNCSVRINGIETLACTTIFKELDVVEPLNNLTILKDLVVDNSNIKNKLLKACSYFEEVENNNIVQSDVDKIEIESSCILCNSCYSSCPVFSVNSDFLGPFALARVYRYVEDKKENLTVNKLEKIQNDGVWDCTLCGACNIVCPQNIDIKGDILKLQNISVQSGYKNPKFSSFGSFDDGFDTNFGGFNPNGF
jgi:fumarate reductase iron-sulfur subunit